MPDYIFKTYIDSGREYYEYTDVTDREQTIKKDFPFPESLMDLLYMDTQELEAITKKMDKALLAFYQSGAKDDRCCLQRGLCGSGRGRSPDHGDRKSTRLNSSHPK